LIRDLGALKMGMHGYHKAESETQEEREKRRREERGCEKWLRTESVNFPRALLL